MEKLKEYAKKRANDVYEVDIEELQQLVIDGANWMKDNMELYEFLYNPMIEESGYITMSIHRNKEGAEKAMEEHKEKEEKEFEDLYKDDDKPFKFGYFESWCVNKIENIVD